VGRDDSLTARSTNRPTRLHLKNRTTNDVSRPKCAVPICNRTATSVGHCNAHRLRLLETGSVRADVPIREKVGRQPPECTVEGCRRPCLTRSLCDSHWRRVKKWGDPFPHIRFGDRTGLWRATRTESCDSAPTDENT
jgi:hypothetical protein